MVDAAQVWARVKTGLQSEAWRDSLIIFLAGRVYYSLIGLLIWWTGYRPPEAQQYYWGVQPVLTGAAGALLGVWQRWDSIHYQRIAAAGYTSDHLSMFYPLYPLLGRWLAALTHLDLLPSLILAGNAAFLLSMLLLHQIIRRRYSRQTARLALAGLVLFPSGVYGYGIFPQPLLLFLVLLTYVLILRGWWAGALATGFLAGLTHSTAIALSFLVGIEALRALWLYMHALRQRQLHFSWNIPFMVLAPLATPLGLASFMVWRAQAGFPSYTEIQQESYQRVLTMPWTGVIQIIRFILSPPVTVNIYAAAINFIVFAVMAALSVWSFRRIPGSWWAMQAGFLVFITTNLTVNNPMICFARFSLIVFPMFVGLALVGQRPRWRLLLFFWGLLLSFVFSAMFFLWLYDMA